MDVVGIKENINVSCKHHAGFPISVKTLIIMVHMMLMHAGYGAGVESVYDLPMVRPPSDVDSNAMQPCPAYERPDRCMCGN